MQSSSSRFYADLKPEFIGSFKTLIAAPAITDSSAVAIRSDCSGSIEAAVLATVNASDGRALAAVWTNPESASQKSLE
jgi:hypothetical protein